MSAVSCQMAVKGTQLFEVPTKKQRLSPEIMTWLLRIIQRPCCEHFHVGTVFFCCFFLSSSTEL